MSGIQASPIVPVTVGGKAAFTVPKGQVVTSDEIEFPVKAQSMVTVSMYSAEGQKGSSITGHPGSRTTSWFAAGNHVSDTALSGAVSSVHWYFLSGIQVLVPKTSSALMILGDSITDGRGSDDNKNNRWPDLLLARLQAGKGSNVAVCNQAAGGNRVLRSGLGPPLLQRYERDAIEQPGVKWVMIFEGVNGTLHLFHIIAVQGGWYIANLQAPRTHPFPLPPQTPIDNAHQTSAPNPPPQPPNPKSPPNS